MNVEKIKVKNYRLLKDFELDLEKNLSLVIGKNNCGKTSLLSIFEKFIGSRSFTNEFSFDDFNIEFKDELKKIIEGALPLEADYPFVGISLKLFIKYDEKDDLSNISQIMMDLDPANKTVVLGFEYHLNYTKLQSLQFDFKNFQAKEQAKVVAKKVQLKMATSEKKATNETAPSETPEATESLTPEGDTETESKLPEFRVKDICHFLKLNHEDYFQKTIKAIAYNIDDPNNPFEDDRNFIDISKEKTLVNKIINFKMISAKREVSNKDPDKSLSFLSSKIYKKTEASDKELKAIEDFKDALSDTDAQLDGIYVNLFKIVVNKVKRFGGIQQGDSIIEIISTLQHRELLEGNTTVMYKHNDKDSLPEHYNGLGYMNLISMIFEIEILIQEFKKDKIEKPSDINILFIEEPEAHTHPQMQYIFIKNIKTLLADGIVREDGENRKLQTIISTHSSHIVSESDFDDIKYFKKQSHSVIAKNLKDLINEYEVDSKEYKFLKQYLTISKAELFFADKAILIEGDTEIILLPTMMRKFDVEEAAKFKASSTLDPELPLLSQNISVVEVGAYSQIFEKFIFFLGIRSLIVTDLDTVDGDGKACEVANGVSHSNSALSFFFDSPTLTALKGYSIQEKVLEKSTKWVQKADGTLCVVYQVTEDGYNARSFEDAFIQMNRDFIQTNIKTFNGIKNPRHFSVATNNSYFLAAECINKKTHFALDILYNSNDDLSNWVMPLYIKEGLQWLKKN